jgi:hypothetical protein
LAGEGWASSNEEIQQGLDLYTQNAEQNESTLWKRLKENKQ